MTARRRSQNCYIHRLTPPATSRTAGAEPTTNLLSAAGFEALAVLNLLLALTALTGIVKLWATPHREAGRCSAADWAR